MITLLLLFFKHGWIFFIAANLANAFTLKSKAKKYIAKNPELKIGYEKVFKALIVFGNIPWLIMAIGDISGMTNTLFDFFNPRKMNPIVLIFHASIVLIWVLSVRWIYFKNGASFLENHPALIVKHDFKGYSNLTAEQIKKIISLMLLGGIIAMILMWVIEIPVPAF